MWLFKIIYVILRASWYFSYGESERLLFFFGYPCPMTSAEASFILLLSYNAFRIWLFALSTADVSSEAR